MQPRTKELALELVSIVITYGVMYAAIRIISNPDSIRTARMSVARRAESFAMGQARTWANVADSAGRVYDSARTTV